MALVERAQGEADGDPWVVDVLLNASMVSMDFAQDINIMHRRELDQCNESDRGSIGDRIRQKIQEHTARLMAITEQIPKGPSAETHETQSPINNSLQKLPTCDNTLLETPGCPSRTVVTVASSLHENSGMFSPPPLREDPRGPPISPKNSHSGSINSNATAHGKQAAVLIDEDLYEQQKSGEMELEIEPKITVEIGSDIDNDGTDQEESEVESEGDDEDMTESQEDDITQDSEFWGDFNDSDSESGYCDRPDSGSDNSKSETLEVILTAPKGPRGPQKTNQQPILSDFHANLGQRPRQQVRKQETGQKPEEGPEEVPHAIREDEQIPKKNITQSYEDDSNPPKHDSQRQIQSLSTWTPRLSMPHSRDSGSRLRREAHGLEKPPQSKRATALDINRNSNQSGLVSTPKRSSLRRKSSEDHYARLLEEKATRWDHLSKEDKQLYLEKHSKAWKCFYCQVVGDSKGACISQLSRHRCLTTTRRGVPCYIAKFNEETRRYKWFRLQGTEKKRKFKSFDAKYNFICVEDPEIEQEFLKHMYETRRRCIRCAISTKQAEKGEGCTLQRTFREYPSPEKLIYIRLKSKQLNKSNPQYQCMVAVLMAAGSHGGGKKYGLGTISWNNHGKGKAKILGPRFNKAYPDNMIPPIAGSDNPVEETLPEATKDSHNQPKHQVPGKPLPASTDPGYRSKVQGKGVLNSFPRTSTKLTRRSAVSELHDNVHDEVVQDRDANDRYITRLYRSSPAEQPPSKLPEVKAVDVSKDRSSLSRPHRPRASSNVTSASGFLLKIREKTLQDKLVEDVFSSNTPIPGRYNTETDSSISFKKPARRPIADMEVAGTTPQLPVQQMRSTASSSFQSFLGNHKRQHSPTPTFSEEGKSSKMKRLFSPLPYIDQIRSLHEAKNSPADDGKFKPTPKLEVQRRYKYPL